MNPYTTRNGRRNIKEGMMAFKLTKDEKKTQAEFVADLRRKADVVRVRIEQAQQRINDAITDYNGSVSDAENFRQEISMRLQSEFDEKSETWQESDNGSAAQELISEWDSDELSGVDDIEIDVPDLEHVEQLERLPAGE